MNHPLDCVPPSSSLPDDQCYVVRNPDKERPTHVLGQRVVMPTMSAVVRGSLVVAVPGMLLVLAVAASARVARFVLHLAALSLS